MIKKIYYDASVKHNPAYQKLMREPMLQCINRYRINELLDEVRSGNANCINNLVESFEPIILMTIKLSNLSHQNIQKMYEAGVDSLLELAKNELNSQDDELFYSFGAWHIFQSLKAKSFPFHEQ